MQGITKLIKHAREGNFSFILQGIKKRLYSKNEAYGLKRDLSVPFKNPEALIPISIRRAKKEDDAYFNADNYNHGIISANLQTCYVATNEDGIPAYRQWLMGSDQNPGIKAFWKGSFPVLAPDEALLENAFSRPEFRGKRIMPAAMARIAEKGNDIGARYIITFVDIHNIPSLKGCKRSGFAPYLLRTERWLLFNRKIRFEPAGSGHMNHFRQVTS
ncbi:GNAT family N-acetyltransferase [Muriicola marianensis]|uniref:GNAT family N-acetyltransferase n=1 Tax=Muriicola marianensis TaxID=1324801 RepID=A0ABQ1QSC9_9FLAO|nr:N-acetyltransferase [Muriicola marianensis]GGD41105.1 hypothetical protein GCM10011361_05250 [Muriicola marianensis]